MNYNKASADFSKIHLGDKRLDKRLIQTVESLEQQTESSILSGCGNKHSAKAFYALLGNEKYSKEALNQAAYTSTRERIKESGDSQVLLVQDTTDINLNGHKKTEGLGYCSEHVRGVKLHSCLALTPDGVPLGLIGQQYESRSEKKINLSAEEKKSRPIEEKESFRWLETARQTLEFVPDNVEAVIICDREGDFYELYTELQSLKTSFVVRLTQDRATTDGERSLQQLRRSKACGEVEISVPRDTRNNRPARTAQMEIACCSVSVARPRRVNPNAPASLSMNLVRITENGEEGKKIEWFLATNLPISTESEVMEVVNCYVQRWKIERFHHVLKSGCQAEKIQQRTYDRIQSVLLIYSVIAVFILAITYMARLEPDVSCEAFLEEDEWKVLYCLINRKKKAPKEPYSLRTAIDYLGELGSYRHSPSDADYGVIAIWKGLFKLFNALDVIDRLMGQV